MKINIKVALLISVLVTLCCVPSLIFADTFDLSYSLTEGGSRLELDSLNSYRGVKLEVSTTVATRYEIIQNITRPIQNRDNPSVILRDNFVVRGLRGTNQYGNLRVPTNDIPVRSNEILYSSNSTGDADSFTLVYGLANIGNLPAGYYQGQISFTLRPIGSTRQEVTKYLYVYINISQEPEVKPSIEFSTPTGAKTITLNPQQEETLAADVLVKISGSFKKLFSINQFLAEPIESNEGSRINYDAVNVQVREAKKGAGTPRIPLSSKPQTLYTSLPNGEADNSFIITYSLGDVSSQKAGRYSSRIQYFLDEIDKQTRLDTMGLEIEIEKLFDLVITPQDEKGVLEFRNLKPKDPPKQNEVTIEIKTNIGKQYQLSQKVISDLTNKEGNVIPSDYFTLRTEDLDTKGTLKFPQQVSVQKGETVLFISDTQGAADKFKLIYELTCPADVKAGDYSTRITYSLLEI